jgi:hypothetical protein
MARRNTSSKSSWRSLRGQIRSQASIQRTPHPGLIECSPKNQSFLKSTIGTTDQRIFDRPSEPAAHFGGDLTFVEQGPAQVPRLPEDKPIP